MIPYTEFLCATPFKIKNSAEFKNKVIPFSHIYVTSVIYKRRIKRSLDDSDKNKLIELRDSQKQQLLNHSRFPVELKTQSINSITDLHNKVAIKDTIVNFSKLLKLGFI